jgi:RHS repeat-associated protein
MLTNGASNVADFQYGFDAGNRVNSELRAFDGKGDAYWYDGLGRLTRTTKDTANPVAELQTPQSTQHAFHREFLMDDDSHRSQVRTTPMGGAAAVTDYTTHGTRHHYTQIQTVGQPAVSRSFDIDGRLTSHGTRTFFYDIVDNLIEVRDGATTVATYTYDALNRRATKVVDGLTTRFVNAGPWVVEDYRRNANGTNVEWLKGTYLHGPGIDNVVLMRHRDWKDVDVDSDYVEPASLYLHANKLGSVTEITAGLNGQVVERYRYEEYGKPSVLDANGVVLAAAVVGNWFLFTGREYDWETGYYHYRARTYDPATGSFLQEDPLGMHDGINVTGYAHANPVNLADPFGTTGIGEAVESILQFINENRGAVAGLLMDLMGPLEGILDLMSAVTGKDITGWLRGGCPQGGPAGMGWWDRAVAAAGAAVKIAAGALRLVEKLKDILGKMQDLVQRGRSAGATAGGALSKCGGGCFIAGTLIVLANGEGLAAIESVEPGTVVACEIPGAMPGSPDLELDRAVTGTSRRTYSGALITLRVAGNDGVEATITGTPDHPFWCESQHRWVPMGSLVDGDLLDGLGASVCVLARSVAFASADAFNLGVAKASSYRISRLGILVHNNCFTSQNQMQKMVERGQSPKGIARVDPPHGPHSPEPHVHFDDGTSLSQSGRPGHKGKGIASPTRAQSEWLEENGWAGGPR